MVKEEHFTEAARLIEALAPHTGRWGEQPFYWAFRGHADARFKLLPTALRGDLDPFGAFVHETHLGDPAARTQRQQVNLEYRVINYFYYSADAAGLPVPDDSQTLRMAALTSPSASFGEEDDDVASWPRTCLLSAIASAQHHGLPTRLLDWTWNPLTAAYFAAAEASRWLRGRKPGPEGVADLAIWALYTQVLFDDVTKFGRADRGMSGLEKGSAPPSVSKALAPYAHNPNLRAQEGIFTLDRHPCSPDEAVARRPLDEAIAADLAANPAWKKGAPKGDGRVLRKLTLPLSQAPALLEILDFYRVNAASRFPGMDGIRMVMQDRLLYDPKP